MGPSEQKYPYTPTTEYGGGGGSGYFPTPLHTEMGQYQQHAGWQMFKQDPYVSVNQTDPITPMATYDDVYNYGGLTPSSAGPREADTPISTVDQRSPSSPLRYSGGQAEGMGLLSSPERAATQQQREISRKPVANKVQGSP